MILELVSEPKSLTAIPILIPAKSYLFDFVMNVIGFLSYVELGGSHSALRMFDDTENKSLGSRIATSKRAINDDIKDNHTLFWAL